MTETGDTASEEGFRNRTLTEKGLSYKLQTLKGKFRSAVSSWTGKATQLSVLLSDSEDCNQIRVIRDELQHCFKTIIDVQGQITELFDDSDEIVLEILNKFERVQTEHMNFMSQVGQELRSIKSEKSSKTSKKTRLSNTSKECARLKANLKYHDVESKMKADLQKLETLKQLEIAEAQACVENGDHQLDLDQLPHIDKHTYVNEYLSKNSPELVQELVNQPQTLNDHSTSHIKPTQTPNFLISNLNPSCNEFVPHVAISQSNQVLTDLAKVFTDNVSLNRLPTPEPTIFQGDPLQYQSWKYAFKTLIDSKNIPPCERIHYLRRYLGDSVRQIVEGCFLVPSDKSYEDARDLLDERFGDPFVVASAFRDKLEAWPRIHSRDASGLLKFSDFLRQCKSAMSVIPELSVLNDCRENRRLLAKLPEWLVSRWNRLVSSYRESKGHFPPFEHFSEFLSKEAKLNSDPITSVQSMNLKESDKPTKSLPRSQSVKGRSFHSSVEGDDNTYVNANSSSVEDTCLMCKNSHSLDDCKSFLQKSIVDRKKFVRENNLCFGCLFPGHVAKFCKNRKTCKICSKLHPTSLHGDLKPSNSNNYANKPTDREFRSGVTFLNDSGSVSKCSAIVPVYISHCDNPDAERLVYALLDSQSDTSFILHDTCRALGVSGTPVNLCLSTMYAENKIICSEKVRGFHVRGFNSHEKIPLPYVYTRDIMPANRSHIPTPSVANTWPHLERIASSLMDLNSCEIGLLIGYNCPQALLPREIIPPPVQYKMGPYGQKTDLGWSIVGIVQQSSAADDTIGLSHRVVACEVPSDIACNGNRCAPSVMFSFKSSVKEVLGNDILRVMERDFSENSRTCGLLSQEDMQFLNILERGICIKDGHYEMPLPFRKPFPILPNNRMLALNRLNGIRKRLISDKRFHDHYFKFMQNLLSKGHAERVTDYSSVKTVWYIPHHGVYHPQKPDKIRVVFDCSSTFQGHSLNQYLLQGPDLTNKLFGVLCRFRKEPVAIVCDVEQMFYQFKVSPNCRDYLRFLWWDTNDLSKDPVDYRMSVHLFGASSSPGCANFGLKRVATDNQDEFGEQAKEFIHKDFYVDDGVKSLPTVTEAIDLIEKTKSMCSKGGLHLHKFISNKKEVLQSLKPEERAQNLVDIDLVKDILPIERTLGLLWCIESDTFQFKIVLKDRPLTRRGILSTVGCLYDPLGLISPVVLLGRQILQAMCAEKADWDDPLPEHLCIKWQKWRQDLECLSSLRFDRCIKPDGFGKVAKVELHHFSDASTVGYGHCSYVRLISEENTVHCALLMGKSRVIPLKPITIPRLELVSATSAAKHGLALQTELDYETVRHVYWTDSKVVLGYINNDARRFHTFVANRVQQIKEFTNTLDWNHIDSKSNPADIASRGISAKNLVENCLWFNGPDFLWKQSLPQNETTNMSVNENDPEIKQSFLVNEACIDTTFPTMLDRLERFSGWLSAKRSIAHVLRYMSILQQRVTNKKVGIITQTTNQLLRVVDLQRAEALILKLVQNNEFADEMEQLNTRGKSDDLLDKQTAHSKVVLKSGSRLRRLDPFVDSEGILRVGGRIRNSDQAFNVKHPAILPRYSHITELLGRFFHERTNHQGRGMTTNEIRQNGYWILGSSRFVSSLVSKCRICRKLRAGLQGQKMADLPSDRLTSAPPFTYCAVDLFGPFLIREGRKEYKKYGVLFTCMGCRAVHVESVNSLESDSFINCLRRFISIRGPIRQLRSDRGSNFVGAERELYQSFEKLNDLKIRQFLLEQDCDYFSFKMNVPRASHMGGVWERQIRSIRSVLSNLLIIHGPQLNDESLRTFFYEAAAIVNSRPLTVENINDPLSCTPLTPNQLLTLKSKVVLPPPGNFQREDLYSRKFWRRTQYLVDQFWSRWKVEFLQNIQVRNKWQSKRRNFQKGDVVIVKDENLPRNLWKLARIQEVTIDDDGLVRKVRVALSSSDLDLSGKRSTSVVSLDRPIHKLVLIQETEDDPIEEPSDRNII